MKIDSSNALQILVLIGGLSLIPAILFTVTGFTRILIVLSFVRSALGTQNTPPNQALVGIALSRLGVAAIIPSADPIAVPVSRS